MIVVCESRESRVLEVDIDGYLMLDNEDVLVRYIKWKGKAERERWTRWLVLVGRYRLW